ncbi:uncharacterized protein CTRU02_212254 [Colletotrichum truncatum]|uniref:Uncharacterized protein n=1 Tax=Colletotrichum truncatum TaxID=5467 RepID=A0ACC3YNK1_COLTU
MAFSHRITRHWGIFALVLLSWVALAHATPNLSVLMPRQVQQTLCSNQNTASTNANLSIWQTGGLCSDFCREKNAAFAVVQWQSCWCSDVAPASSSQAEISDKCNDICPGYDIERCGSRPNWYGYIQLAKTPTSTAGGGSDTTTKAPSTTSTAPQETSTSSSKTTTSSTISTTSKPGTTIKTVTADGTVKTVTVTPTATGADGATGASELTPSSRPSGNGMSTGAVVGVVVGVIAAVVAFAGLGLFLFFRRRKQNQQKDMVDTPSHRGSSSGHASSPRNLEMVVTVDGGRWDADATSDHRRSRLMAHDPRMEPLGRGLYMNNKSAESINTLRDDQDYSRKVHKPVLRATNPDPDPQ